MSDMISENDPSLVESKSSFSISQIEEVKAWLVSQFDAVGKDVPDFKYTSQSISHLHNLATLSQANTQAALIVANDLHQKASKYRSQGRHLFFFFLRFCTLLFFLFHIPILIKQRFAMIMIVAARIREILERVGLANETAGDISLKKNGVEEKRNQLQRESKILLDHTRKAITRLTYLKRYTPPSVH
ncbi:hypothetical protein ACSBR1_031439 [Camellia fascicularis]